MATVHHSWEAQGVFATRLYSPLRCVAWVEQAKRSRQWCEAEVAIDESGNSGANPTSRWARILHGPIADKVRRDFESRIRREITPLIRGTWGANLRQCHGTQLIRYRKGGHYVPHSDVGTGDLARRLFTVLCYLNEDFRGGRTGFPSLGYSATPQAGKVIVFPSSYLHCAEPVVHGQKFVALTWLCGPAPVRWI
ncbi:MAG TPA: 2OG-Fe(II) oxygenase [Terriglobales bacterium]|nr:2OG-Fe(II) oxygenase [Terriglobales bacterium]